MAGDPARAPPGHPSSPARLTGEARRDRPGQSRRGHRPPLQGAGAPRARPSPQAGLSVSGHAAVPRGRQRPFLRASTRGGRPVAEAPPAPVHRRDRALGEREIVTGPRRAGPGPAPLGTFRAGFVAGCHDPPRRAGEDAVAGARGHLPWRSVGPGEGGGPTLDRPACRHTRAPHRRSVRGTVCPRPRGSRAVPAGVAPSGRDPVLLCGVDRPRRLLSRGS